MSDRIVRAPRDEHERATLERVLQESFGNEGLPWTTWMERIGHENLRVVIADGAIRGGLGFYRFGQHWGGERVPMIGLAGVGVEPSWRGRGIARTFLVDTLAQARSEGVPLAGLYASSVAVYRAIGFEQAGVTLRFEAPVASLARGDHALACEPFDPLENAHVRPLYDARARRWDGHLVRTEAIWARITQPYQGTARAYRFGPASAPEGYIVYSHQPGADLHFGIALRDLVLATPAAARRCAALLSDLRSLGRDLRWLGCASDPLVSLLPEESARIVEPHRWMLRILDPARALAMRGYSSEGEASFVVRDALFGDHALHVRVRDGRAEVDTIAARRELPTLDTRALAALYSGFANVSTLVAMGLVEGSIDGAHALARLFTRGEPWLCDWF
ncbi:GNAT family N-acetyltransferase [Sandaracinus amylolyticus]|nr:GNAT family N-acetyltransferase [Sandaracinus amylolyticus]